MPKWTWQALASPLSAELAERLAGGDLRAGFDAVVDRLEVGEVVAHAVVAEDRDGQAAAGGRVVRPCASQPSVRRTSRMRPLTGDTSVVPQPVVAKMSEAG